METWQQINVPVYSQYYEASTLGRVRKGQTGRVLKGSSRNGYLAVKLSAHNIGKTINIHRIVALTFLDGEPKDCVNHKNGDRTDNRVANLEWCSFKENSAHALTTRLTKPSTKKVEQYSYDGETLIAIFDSIKEAEEFTDVGARLISQVCRGQKPTAHGFVWRYDTMHETTQVAEVVGEVVPDFPNYIVTRDGKIYSIRSKRYLIVNHSNEYGYVKLCNNGVQKDAYVHVLVAKAFLPNWSAGKVANHKNSNKRDNRAENLEWITESENMLHHQRNKKKKAGHAGNTI